MLLSVDKNYFNFVVPNTKTRHLSIIYQVKKKSKYDYINMKLLANSIKKRLKDMTQEEFIEYKINNYDAYFEIDVRDQCDHILLEYSLNIVETLEIDFEEISLMFKKFCEDISFDVKDLTTQINTEKLIIKDLKQNHKNYAYILSNDILFQDSEYYLTLKEKEKYLNEIKQIKTTMFENLKNSVIIEKTISKNKIVSTDLTIASYSNYEINKKEDYISDQNLDQSIVILNYKLNKNFSKNEINTFNSFFGNGAHSLLFKIIREKNQLCYYVYSSIVENNLKITAGISNDKIDYFISEIEKIIDNFEVHLTEEKLSIAKEMIINSYLKKENDFSFNYALLINNLYSKNSYDINHIVKEVKLVDKNVLVEIVNNIEYINKVVLK